MVTSSGPSVTIPGLASGTDYWIDVRAENSEGNSSYTDNLATSTSDTVTTTTDTDTIYRLATAAPGAPSGGTGVENHTPTGWQRNEPSPTETEGVYRATRTRTFLDGVFSSATAWGNVVQIAEPTGSAAAFDITATASPDWERSIFLNSA